MCDKYQEIAVGKDKLMIFLEFVKEKVPQFIETLKKSLSKEAAVKLDKLMQRVSELEGEKEILEGKVDNLTEVTKIQEGRVTI